MKKKQKKVWNHEAYIKSALRKIWRWSPQRRECLKAKKCCKCSGGGKLYADHVSPVVETRKGFQGWDIYISRLFEGTLQPLCEKCHSIKSKAEAKERAKSRKERKALALALPKN